MSGPSELAVCSWGRLRLFASQINTDVGRTQVVHELSSGDDHPVQNRGLRARRVRCKLQFDDFPNQPPALEAARALEAAKNTGEVAVFSHPLLGRFSASIGDFTFDIDENSVISADAEFIKESEDIAVTPAGAASGAASGESSVAAAAAAMDGELAKIGQLKMSGPAASNLLARIPGGASMAASLSARLSTSLSVNLSASFSATLAASITASAQASAAATGNASAVATGSASTSATVTATASASAFAGAFASADASAFADASAALAATASAEARAGLFAAVTVDARVAVARWSNEDVPTRQILIDAARISDNIAIMIEAGGFEFDLALWPAFRAAIMLGESIRGAAISATSETSAVFVMRVVQPTALLPLAARIYGGASAQDRARQIAELNDISTPGWIPPGDYLMPVRPTARA